MGTFYRWVPKSNAEEAIGLGLRSWNGSAKWIFGMGEHHVYRPGSSITRPTARETKNCWAVLIAYDMDDIATLNVTTREHLNFENPDFKGEAAHPTKIIVKENELGAFGLGKMRQGATNFHTNTRYATKKEVAKALGLNILEIDDGHKPPNGGWPA